MNPYSPITVKRAREPAWPPSATEQYAEHSPSFPSVGDTSMQNVSFDHTVSPSTPSIVTTLFATPNSGKRSVKSVIAQVTSARSTKQFEAAMEARLTSASFKQPRQTPAMTRVSLYAPVADGPTLARTVTADGSADIFPFGSYSPSTAPQSIPFSFSPVPSSTTATTPTTAAYSQPSVVSPFRQPRFVPTTPSFSMVSQPVYDAPTFTKPPPASVEQTPTHSSNYAESIALIRRKLDAAVPVPSVLDYVVTTAHGSLNADSIRTNAYSVMDAAEQTRRRREAISEKARQAEILRLRDEEIKRTEQRVSELRLGRQPHWKLDPAAQEKEIADHLARLESEKLAAKESNQVQKRIDMMYTPLTPAEREQVSFALEGGDDQELLVVTDGGEITREKMQCLIDLEWLNDEVINVFLRLLRDRVDADAALPRVHCFNTFFYAKLVDGPKGYDFKAVSRWTTRAKVDIFAQDKVIIPVHMGSHWCCAVIDMHKKRTEYYDSLSGRNDHCHKMLLQYLKDEWKEKKKSEFDASGWTTYTPSDIPHQHNGCDCGVFSCMYAYFASMDTGFQFSQKQIPHIRNWMICRLLEKKVP
eukprot:TRINITY_DN12991_c0_g1_i1.p1 TRINITY_DN12991_c0_g1~~TRINITY_DN12991_c0_g1_i1.p1  ORF type:complete len:586 (-),score=103.51 TRINITY_DN12991_c0_g1_i1:3-1760(-)